MLFKTVDLVLNMDLFSVYNYFIVVDLVSFPSNTNDV